MKSALSANVLGCTCKTCECIKRYCVCYANSVPCDPKKCKCRSCKNNRSESKNEMGEIQLGSNNINDHRKRNILSLTRNSSTKPAQDEIAIQLPSLLTSTDVINKPEEVLRETVETLSRFGPILSSLDHNTLQRLGDNAQKNVLTILSTISPDLLTESLIKKLRALIDRNDETGLNELAIEGFAFDYSTSQHDEMEDVMKDSPSTHSLTENLIQSDKIAVNDTTMIQSNQNSSLPSNLKAPSQSEEATYITNPLNLMASVATKALQKNSIDSISLVLSPKQGKSESEEDMTNNKNEAHVASLQQSKEDTLLLNIQNRKKE